MKPFYAIKVDPGNKTIRKRADQMITAQLLGFTAPKVRFFAKYASASQVGSRPRCAPSPAARLTSS